MLIGIYRKVAGLDGISLHADYGLDIDAIRHVLSGLLAAGVIEADKRNSYKLSEFLGDVQEQSVFPLKQG